jgi:O-antigen/teichoic acid export membrane protein
MNFTLNPFNFLRKGSVRDINIKRNVTFAFLLQFVNIACGFIQIPIILSYVDQTRYGVWLTLSSLTTFLYLFDIGLGNGLRNRFAEAFAKRRYLLARVYVSTTYALTSLIILGLLLFFFVLNPMLNWAKILNAPSELSGELKVLVLYVISFFCFQLVLKLVTTILIAMQKSALYNLQLALTSLLNLIFVLILVHTTKGSLLYLGIGLGLSPLIILLIFSAVFFMGPLRQFAPSIRYVRMSHGRSVMGLGVKFFVIQMASIVVFQIHSILIAQLFGPAEVTPFNIAYRYFGVINTAFSIVMFPFWSAFTDAYNQGDRQWIRSSVNKLTRIWLAFFAAGIFMLLISGFVYRIWIGNKITIPFVLSLSLLVYYGIMTWGGIFISFVNGIGKVNLQFVFAIISILATVPISIFLAKTLGLGVVGIVLSSCLMNFFGLIVAPWQYYREIILPRTVPLNN